MSKKRKRTGQASARTFFDGKLSGRFFLWALIAAILLWSTGKTLAPKIMDNKFFLVKEIYVNNTFNYVLPESVNALFRKSKGRSIFRIDLKEAALLVSREMPFLNRVEINRRFPDKLEVNLVGRTPAAYVDSSLGAIVDRDGVVVATGIGYNDAVSAGLIMIKGLRLPPAGVRPGYSLEGDGIKKVLELVDALKSAVIKSRRVIKYVDVGEKNNIVINIDGVMFKFGSDAFMDKIGKLKRLLEDPKINMKDMSYIDLRFEDPVISPR